MAYYFLSGWPTIFLPFLGLDLKKEQEHVEKEVKGFTILAQIAYLYFLYHKEDVLNTTEFANKMGFNKMTASRALNDLYQANLIILGDIFLGKAEA